MTDEEVLRVVLELSWKNWEDLSYNSHCYGSWYIEYADAPLQKLGLIHVKGK